MVRNALTYKCMFKPYIVRYGTLNSSHENIRIGGRIAVMLDVIWKNRNNLIWNNEQEEGLNLACLPFGIDKIDLMLKRVMTTMISSFSNLMVFA